MTLLRWYFAIDAPGSTGPVGDHARLAVLSARMVGGLDPFMLYHGAEGEFCAWMRAHGVTIIHAEPPALDAMRAARTAGHFTAHSIGHWLRLAIPHIDHDATLALYTDCDVVFLRRPRLGQLTPTFFAAAPEFAPDRWNYFNSGVMLLNLPAMRASAPALESFLRDRLADPAAAGQLDDQILLNQAYRGHWERLNPLYNWKPYWGFAPDAAILHFHGAKRAVIDAICAQQWNWNDPVAASIGALFDAHRPAYQTWLSYLGDQLQSTDFTAALSLHATASAIAHYARNAPPRSHDLRFTEFRMFPE